MQYREIVAVTGLGGLYQLLSTKSDGAIVRSLGDGSSKFISSRQHNVTPLESIEIYTTGSNVRLHDVLQAMKESSTSRPDAKADNNAIRAYFGEVYPDMDEDRVYTSDMKKMLKWFEILKGAELMGFSAMNAAEHEGAPEDAAAMPAEGDVQIAEHDKEGDNDMPLVEEGEKQPKKARTKKAASDEGNDEKPAKKTAAKKNAEGEAAPKKAAKKRPAEDE